MDKFNMYMKSKYERSKMFSEAVMVINFRNSHLSLFQSELTLAYLTKLEVVVMRIQSLELL